MIPTKKRSDGGPKIHCINTWKKIVSIQKPDRILFSFVGAFVSLKRFEIFPLRFSTKISNIYFFIRKQPKNKKIRILNNLRRTKTML